MEEERAGGDRDAVSVPCLEGKKDDNGERTGTGGGTARKVALTFDDGPSEYTVELSRGLKERRVQATFFLLGENMEGRRKMVEELVKDGHLIGNHSYHHVQLNKLSIKEATGEIEKTNRLIREWTGVWNWKRWWI